MMVKKMNNYCNENVKKIIERVRSDFDAIENNENILNELFKKDGKYIFLATGSSFTISFFWAKIINIHYGCFTKAVLPRDFIYSNYDNVDKIIVFSYSGVTNDLVKAVEKIKRDKIIIFSKGKIDEISDLFQVKKENIVSYYNDDFEIGFINFEATIFPCMYLLSHTVDKINIDFLCNIINKWDEYFKGISKDKRLTAFFNDCVNIFYGDMCLIGALDFENKLVESGICNAIMHEKKNFSHGRYVLYEKQKERYNIYFKRKNVDQYEIELLNYLKKDYNIIIESEFNDILCEFDLLVASMILIKYIGDIVGIDPSFPTNLFSGDKLYKYNG